MDRLGEHAAHDGEHGDRRHRDERVEQQVERELGAQRERGALAVLVDVAQAVLDAEGDRGQDDDGGDHRVHGVLAEDLVQSYRLADDEHHEHDEGTDATHLVRRQVALPEGGLAGGRGQVGVGVVGPLGPGRGRLRGLGDRVERERDAGVHDHAVEPGHGVADLGELGGLRGLGVVAVGGVLAGHGGLLCLVDVQWTMGCAMY